MVTGVGPDGYFADGVVGASVALDASAYFEWTLTGAEEKKTGRSRFPAVFVLPQRQPMTGTERERRVRAPGLQAHGVDYCRPRAHTRRAVEFSI